MGLQISFDKSISLTKLTAYLACTWPPPSSAAKWKIIAYNIRWCISFINIACIFLGMVYAIYEHYDNALIVTQSVCLAGSLTSLMIKMITYKIQLKSTQTRIEEIEHILKFATSHEKKIFHRYSTIFSKIHVFVIILAYLTPCMGIFQTLYLRDQPLPSRASYPFSVESGVVRTLAFIQQCIGAYQCSSGSAATCQAALMLWFAGARLEILTGETKSISTVRGIPDFVGKHKNRLAYAVDVSISMRYFALASSLASGLTAIMGSIVCFSNQPLAQKMRFVPVTLVGLVNLFVCAWPADNLIHVCHSLGNAVYNISWIDMPVRTRKNLLMIIQRCQRPVTVSVRGLLPTLSLRFYAAFLAAVYSYFTTLRAVMSDGAK